MDNALAARRLSAALGRKFAPEDVERLIDGYVRAGRKIYCLYAGNACYVGNGVWMKNGREWVEAWDDKNVPQPL